MKGISVALGGGGIRGLAHIGVLQVLKENKIPVEKISGTSAGSIIASLYASGMSPNEMEKIAMKLKPADYLDYNYKGIINYLLGILLPGKDAYLNGIFKGNKIENLIYKLSKGKHLKDIKMPLAIIACDIDTGREIVFSNRPLPLKDTEMHLIQDALISEAVRCSISIPTSFIPRNFKGMQMVDGGLKEIVPVVIQKIMGAEYILAVNLQEQIYHEKVQGIPHLVSRTIGILTAETSDLAEKLYADMVIYPEIIKLGLEDIDQARKIIQAGRHAMLKSLDKLKSDLKL